MDTSWFWDIETFKAILNKPEVKYKYFVTDDKDEFLNRLEIITNRSVLNTRDNLRYLEQLDKIRQVREGANIFEVFPWLKKDNNNA